jgi:hypothetical protein
MAIPIISNWQHYFDNPNEGLGSSYERIILNMKLMEMINRFNVQSILEAPSFGFTGVSGINSMGLAKNGKDITLIDNNLNRLKQIELIWQEMNLPLETVYSSDFTKINLPDNSHDMSWNFSALWFTVDLSLFLAELVRITRKIILLCVPNRTGLGYISQKLFSPKDSFAGVMESNIHPSNFLRIMAELGWHLRDSGYLDCPPWPDIGMPKEELLARFGLKFMLKKKKSAPLSILNYYSGKDVDFKNRMLKYYGFEKSLPVILKRFWAHHRYFMFLPNE